MLLHGSHVRWLGAIGMCLFTCSVLPRGAADAAAPGSGWRDFGTLLLYRWGTDCQSSARWLDADLDTRDPNSRLTVAAAEAILRRSLDGYGSDAIAIQGRIPLDINPQCILGLHLSERFPGTRLGDWGSRQFDHAIEQACLVMRPAAGDAWRAQLESEMSAAGATRGGPGGREAWAATEMPYLYVYLIRGARTAEVRRAMRERLARCLEQECGLEPALRQYLILLDEGGPVDGTWLAVAALLERTGAPGAARRVYEGILRNGGAGADTRAAFENLVPILLRESQHREARQAWALLSQKLPPVECTAPEVKGFLDDFQLNRAQTGQRLWGELATMTDGPRALQSCRLLDALWTPEEALSSWQAAVEQAPPGSLAQQLGRAFLAAALLEAGRADAAEALIRSDTESANPFVQARCLAVFGAIAQARGAAEESVRHYARAAQIDRPSALPSWYKGLVQDPPAGAQTPAAELAAQRLFFQGCNLLIEADYAGAVDNLRQAADLGRLPDPQQRALPCVMMLACLGIEDYAQAEVWGYRALESRRLSGPDPISTEEVLVRIQDTDATVSRLLVLARNPATDAARLAAAAQDLVDLCDAGTNLTLSGRHEEEIDSGVRQLYTRARKRHLARVLTAEYLGTALQEKPGGTRECSARLRPLFYAAQVLSEDSFDRIRERLAARGEAQDLLVQMYRFAAFARSVKRLDLVESALDAVARAPASAVPPEVWEGVAGMYLATSHHRKAIEVYEKAVQVEEPAQARAVLLRIVDICAENLKNYDEAMRRCEEFIRQYPGSPQAIQVEFLLGRYAYLRKDYSGAVGQLDGFQKKYAEHPQVGQAMLLAGLSRMAEGNTREAIGRFGAIIRRYPDSDLAAHSKFLIGYAQVSAQQYAAAMETFKQLVEQFPQSSYVPQAQNLLERLRRVSP